MQIIASAAHPRYHTLADDEFFAKRPYNWVKWGKRFVDVFSPSLKEFVKTESGKTAISKEFYADFPGSSGVIFIVKREANDNLEELKC